MDLITDLQARALIHEATGLDALRGRIAEGPLTLYYGCDPTADSLHVGNLIGLLVLRRFAEAGHRPIALAGGATGMVGDPSGRSEERNLLDDATLDRNVAAIKEQIARIVHAGQGEALLVDNRDWTAPLTVLEFLRDVGKHVTVNQMLARESVRGRLESEHGISYTEFSYMLLQANDYLWLHEHHGCELQIGGSDQWGNILSGVDLIRRRTGRSVHALCWPLLTAPDGSKLGKTTGARVWLDAGRTSPYEFFQHWMRTDDRQVGLLLGQFTLLPIGELEEVVAEHEAAPERRVGQRRLAVEATTLVHGPDAARAAAEASVILFGGDPTRASPEALAVVRREVPGSSVTAAALADPVALVVAAGLATSNGDARRTLAQRGYRVNGEVLDADTPLAAVPRLGGRFLLLRKGRSTYHVVEVVA